MAGKINVWTSKIPTPWVNPIINRDDDYEELAKQCRERWENEIKEWESDVLETFNEGKAKAPNKSNE